MERVRPKPDTSLGWAYRPDSGTVASLHRGTQKLKDHKNLLGVDRPHEGGNLEVALAEARKEMEERRGIGKKRKRRRRHMARKVTLKELDERKGKPSKKKAAVKKEPAEEATGKMIALKTICQELDLDPKATRVKLRRMIEKGEIDWHDHAQRWEFTPKRAKEVRALLTE